MGAHPYWLVIVVCILVTWKSMGKVIFAFVRTSAGQFICAVSIFKAEE